MKQKHQGWWNPRWMVVLLTILSRLPFVFSTFGSDPNAWRIAHSGLRLWREGFFQVSRLPGFPVPELSAALIVPSFGAIGMNLVSTLLAAGAVNYFYKICEKLKVPQPALASLAFSFVPVLFVSSMTSLDYIWSLFFFIVGLNAILSQRYWLAGIAMGLAIGSRLTYAALLLPLALLAQFNQKKRHFNPQALATVIGLAATVGGFCFIPIVKAYNASILLYDFQSLASPTLFHFDHVTMAFGALGLVALMVFAIFRILGPRTVAALPKEWVLASTLVYLIYVPAALIFAEGPIYFLPVLPFLIVQVFYRSPIALQWVFTGLMVLSPFVLRFDHGEFHVTGWAVHELRQRLGNGQYLLRVANQPGLDSEKNLIIVGQHFAELAFRLYESGRSMPGNWREFTNSIEIQGLKGVGKEIYYLKGQDEYIRSTMGFDLKAEGARELEITL